MKCRDTELILQELGKDLTQLTKRVKQLEYRIFGSTNKPKTK